MLHCDCCGREINEEKDNWFEINELEKREEGVEQVDQVATIHEVCYNILSKTWFNKLR